MMINILIGDFYVLSLMHRVIYLLPAFSLGLNSRYSSYTFLTSPRSDPVARFARLHVASKCPNIS